MSVIRFRCAMFLRMVPSLLLVLSLVIAYNTVAGAQDGSEVNTGDDLGHTDNNESREACTGDDSGSELYHAQGVEFLYSGNYKDAIICFTKSLANESGYLNEVMCHTYRSVAYEMIGNYKLALADIERQIQIAEEYAKIDGYRGEKDEYVLDYYGREITFEAIDAIMRRAWILATCPDLSVLNAKQAVRDAYFVAKELPIFTTFEVLAAALTRAGSFDEAVRTQNIAIAMAQQFASEHQSTDTETHLPAMVSRLNLYKHGKPYTESESERYQRLIGSYHRPN